MKLFLLFLALAFAWCDASEIACQSYHESEKLLIQTCDRYDYLSQHICGYLELDVDPSEVRRLKIQKCQSIAIRNASETYEHIEHLEFSNGVFDWLGDLKPFGDLTEFTASNNSLLIVPKAIVENCPKLKTLILDDNPLTRIHHGDFEQSQQLETISMSNCLLESIDVNAFGNLSDLKELRLNKNAFLEIPKLSFLNHPISVDLRQNKISTLNCESIAAMGPATVRLSWEYVMSFSGFKGCGARKIRIKQSAHDTGNEIRISTVDGNWELHCSHQSFSKLSEFVAGADAFENIRDILPLISENVTKLDLSDNNIGYFNSLFERFRHLKELRLGNTQLTSFDVAALSPSVRNELRVIDISNNHLNEIKNSFELRYFSGLSEFFAGGNQIQNVSDVIASLSQYLQQLNLAHSNVGEIDRVKFYKFRNLDQLDLSDAQISFADFGVFPPLYLTSLNISGNNLSQVDVASISQLQNLRELRAANCQISNVSELIQHLGPLIETLDLSGNSASEFDPNLFKRLGHLKKLSLSGMGLQQLNSSMFENLTSMRHLDLSENGLTDLDVDRLPKHLEHLHLNKNNLRKIENLDRKHFPVLRTLSITKNQLKCEYVDELREQFNDNILLVGFKELDPFEQQNTTCHSNLVFILLCIFAALLILLIVICACFLCRERLCKKDY